jgi:hypothetical protein
MRKKLLYCFVLSVLSASNACSAEPASHDMELAVERFLQTVSSCPVDANIESVTRAADTDFDFARTKPVIHADDLQVLAVARFCDEEDKYYLWLRRSGEDYAVITYTSLSQPE